MLVLWRVNIGHTANSQWTKVDGGRDNNYTLTYIISDGGGGRGNNVNTNVLVAGGCLNALNVPSTVATRITIGISNVIGR